MSAVRSRVAAAAVVAIALGGGYLAQGTFAAGTPANKVAASGSSVDVLGANQDAVVLSATVKINNPTDLILSATAECALTTQVTNGANGQTSRAAGQIKFYVTIDGLRVPIASGDTDNGEVVFCSRVQEQQWTDSNDPVKGMDDSGDQLRQYLDTRNANGFNWMALNVGTNYPGTTNNIHSIQLHAVWSTSTMGAATAKAIVGNRTLILDPVKAAHGATVVDLG